MDDLLDLDFTKPSNQPTSNSIQSNYGSGRTAFDYLAQSSSSSSTNSTPIYNPIRTTQSQAQPPPPQKKSQSNGGDAFAELFGGTSTNNSSSTTSTSLSMAERLRQERQQLYQQPQQQRVASPVNGGLGVTTSPSSSRANSPMNRSNSPSTRIHTPPIPRSSAPSPASSLLNPTSNTRTTSPSPSSLSPNATTTNRPPDPWDFDLLTNSVSSTSSSKPPPPAAANNDDVFDLGFDSPTPPSTTTKSPAPSRSKEHESKPSSYSHSKQQSEFDLLGAFSQPPPPPSSLPPSSRSSPQPSQRPSESNNKKNNDTEILSPPDHLIAQLVEMGFSPSKSRQALLKSQSHDGRREGGFELEKALELLMNDQQSSSERVSDEVNGSGNGEKDRNGKSRAKSREEEEWGDEGDVRIGRRRSWERDDNDQVEKQSGSQRIKENDEGDKKKEGITRGGRRTAVGEGAGVAGGGELSAKQLQDQANEVLQQAHKIGINMFKSANQYWGMGKEALAKKVEEQRLAARVAAGLPLPGNSGDRTTIGGRGGRQDGKPKWWREGMDLDEQEQETKRGGSAGVSSGFKDSDDEDEGPESALPQRRPTPRSQSATTNPSSGSNNAEYRSPFRRAKATPASNLAPSQPLEADLLSGSSAPTPSPPTKTTTNPSPAVPSTSTTTTRPRPSPSSSSVAIARPRISISSSALSTALSHKTTGNEHFKLGRFGDATTSYTLALEQLPSDWIGRCPLLNNRAQARLKSGQEREATKDCTEVLRIVLGGGSTTTTTIDCGRLEMESKTFVKGIDDDVVKIGGEGMDLRDQVGKALSRRAKGYEADEKWKLALQDWESVRNEGDEIVIKGAGGIKVVSDGISRCRKMVDRESGGGAPTSRPSAVHQSTSSAPAVRPRPRPRPVASAPAAVQGSGEALRNHQANQAALAAEDDLRHSLKDQVDERISSWKNGKETNLRALIASLDNVLWSELGWKKVGMHELISESQLKVKYVRAIAKVHPDKLNVGNTTVEQRMIAGAVFSTLNEAWNSTKS